MVGRSVKTPEEAADHFLTLRNKKLQEESTLIDIIAEVKYDGERTQIHYSGGEVNLFSRNFDSQNKKFWLLRERLHLFFEKCRNDFLLYKWQDVNDFIIDGEIVFVNEDGQFLEFQDIDRKYKNYNTSANVLLKQPKVLIFDILGLNGQSLCSLPLKYRKKILARKLSLGAKLENEA